MVPLVSVCSLMVRNEIKNIFRCPFLSLSSLSFLFCPVLGHELRGGGRGGGCKYVVEKERRAEYCICFLNKKIMKNLEYLRLVKIFGR
jgi:hypothetical protein